MTRSTGRYTAGQLRTDLRRIMHRTADNDALLDAALVREPSFTDQRLAELRAPRAWQT